MTIVAEIFDTIATGFALLALTVGVALLFTMSSYCFLKGWGLLEFPPKDIPPQLTSERMNGDDL